MKEIYQKKWNTTALTDVREIRNLMANCQLPGRKIQNINLTGRSYFHNRDDIEDYAYRQLYELSEDERQVKSNYKNIAIDMPFPCAVTIDEPFIIIFEDGDAFEIDILYDGKYKMSLNGLPKLAHHDITESNIIASRLFSQCLEQTISDVEIYTFTTNKEPLYGTAFSEPPFDREFVKDIILRFTDGTGLRFGAWIDYGQVDYIDSERNHIVVPFSKLKQCLKDEEDC